MNYCTVLDLREVAEVPNGAGEDGGDAGASLMVEALDPFPCDVTVTWAAGVEVLEASVVEGEESVGAYFLLLRFFVLKLQKFNTTIID